MDTQTLATCHACGAEYQDPILHGEPESFDFDICFDCRRTKRLFAIVADGDPEGTLYAAGVQHLFERMVDDVYPDFSEFSNAEWQTMSDEQKNHSVPILMAVSGGVDEETAESLTLDDIRSRVAQFVANMQKTWDDGVRDGILRVNYEGGKINGRTVIVREWPTTFRIDVYEPTLAELVENGVCVA